MPPRINIHVGGGKSTSAGKSGKKRKREDLDEEKDRVEHSDDKESVEIENEPALEDSDGEDDAPTTRHQPRQQSKTRRVETLGRKVVEKEKFKKAKARQKQKQRREQWESDNLASTKNRVLVARKDKHYKRQKIRERDKYVQRLYL